MKRSPVQFWVSALFSGGPCLFAAPRPQGLRGQQPPFAAAHPRVLCGRPPPSAPGTVLPMGVAAQLVLSFPCQATDESCPGHPAPGASDPPVATQLSWVFILIVADRSSLGSLGSYLVDVECPNPPCFARALISLLSAPGAGAERDQWCGTETGTARDTPPVVAVTPGRHHKKAVD